MRKGKRVLPHKRVGILKIKRFTERADGKKPLKLGSGKYRQAGGRRHSDVRCGERTLGGLQTLEADITKSREVGYVVLEGVDLRKRKHQVLLVESGSPSWHGGGKGRKRLVSVAFRIEES